MPAMAMTFVMVAMTPAMMLVAPATVMPAPTAMMVMPAVVLVTPVSAPAILRRDDPALGRVGEADSRCERRSLRRTGGEGTERDGGCQEPGP